MTLTSGEVIGDCARFGWSDGFTADYAQAWLLDNAPAGRTASGQRHRPASSLDKSLPLRGIAIVDDRVVLTFAEDVVTWTSAQLRAPHTVAPARTLWSRGTDMEARAIAYRDYLVDDKALATALDDVATFGFARLADAGTDAQELERTVRRFGFVRETNYGRLFEVRVATDSDNLANTTQALEPHTDNPYRNPVPTLQLLHGIRDAGVGGATTFVDGFALTADFRAAHPDDFAHLAAIGVPFAYRDSHGLRYEARTPVLRLTADGEISGIRFNHRALQPLDQDAETTARWYAAYRHFAAMLASPKRAFSITLRPGDIVIFDNERILHGREGFAAAPDRLLMGCYADRDGLLATLSRLI